MQVDKRRIIFITTQLFIMKLKVFVSMVIVCLFISATSFGQRWHGHHHHYHHDRYHHYHHY
jgi:hypothetical protein